MKPRIAFYSHDAQGLGHMRRNLALATRAVQDRGRSALLIAGAREAGAVPMPHGVECLTLPALSKSVDGEYRPRSLDLSLSSLLRLRAETLCSVVEVFEPDVLVVDKHPLGFGGELAAAIELLKARGGTRLVLGLREVLDEAEVVSAEWSKSDIEGAIATYYDRIWVYGDPAVYDPVVEYGLSPAAAAKTRYTGYLVPDLAATADAAPDRLGQLGLPSGRLALCLVGGGQDGAELAQAFARAPLPQGMAGVVVAGPFMPAQTRRLLHALAAERSDLRVLDFVQEPQLLLPRADRVVAMGGYNTVCELLAVRCPVLIVPRERPRREQLIRAERLAALGAVDMLRAQDLGADAIASWLARPARASTEARIDVDGLRRVPALLADALVNARAQEASSLVAR